MDGRDVISGSLVKKSSSLNFCLELHLPKFEMVGCYDDELIEECKTVPNYFYNERKNVPNVI